MDKKIRKIAEFESTRDYLRHIVKIVCERLEIKDIDVYKLNSKEDCIKCIESIVKNYNSSQDNQALYKEIDSLKEELEILNTGNKRLEAEKALYITQAEERKKEKIYKEFYKNMVDKWETNYKFQEVKNKIVSDFNIFLSFVIVLETLLIAMLIWK